MSENIKYASRQISEFYSSHRQSWNELYPSEKWAFEKVAGDEKMLGDVLDAGCACGGLGSALSEKFTLNSYTGIDINEDAIDWANRYRKLSVPARFISGDIIKEELNDQYDTVVSLSCADWNIETARIINTCWKSVKREGYFVITLRLTTAQGINDIKKSYQYINYSEKEKNPEIANYVVFNFKDALKVIKELSPPPELIGAYGYWGRPSPTAVTLFDKLIFAAFYIKKAAEDSTKNIQAEFDLPVEVFL